MFCRLSRVCVCLSALMLLAAAPPDDAAKPVLDRALKALGDEAKLAKFQTGVAKGKVTGEEGGQEMNVTFEASWRGLDRYRIESDIGHGGRNFQAIVVLNGDQAWAKFADKEDNPPEGVVPLIKNALHALRMPQLLSTFKNPAYKLTPTGESKVGDRLAVGFAVALKDYKEVTLYFDKETGLPVKSEVQLSTPHCKDVNVEYIYSDYKDFGGVKQPGKITIKAHDENPKEFTMVIEHVGSGEKLADSTFEKP